jgi:ABC-2 type transport system permease protein
MRRWLKIARAEVLRDLKTTLRYPIELATGVFVLFILFMAIFTGMRTMMGSAAAMLTGNVTNMVIGYSMWFFAMIAINTVSTDIESESRQGTLEQVYIHAPSYLGLIWVRAITHLILGSGAVLMLSLLIQLATGNWVHIELQQIAPMLLVMALTLAGLSGFGLILGGMSLVFKRIGQLSALVQFGLIIPAVVDISQLQEPVRSLAAHLPLCLGVNLLRRLLVDGGSFKDVAHGCVSLTLDSAVYIILGSVVFSLMERAARKGGMLSHY